MAEPKVRFKKDDGSSYPEWTVGNLGDYGTFIRGLSYGKDDVTLENDKTLVLRSNNIREDKVLDYLNGLQFVVKKPQNEQLLKNGDIVICMANGSNRLVGKAARYNGKYEGVITVGAFCGIYRPYNFPVAQFIFQTFSYDSFLALNVQGGDGAIANLKGDDILGYSATIPCFEEQQKIADFLSSVDEVITASEREVANLETQKKAVMKKVFSQEVRFKKADGSEFPEWKEQSFENAFEPLNNNTFSRDMLNYDFGPALNIHYGDILVKYGDVCDIQAEVLPYVNEGISISKYAYLHDGDIILADTAEDETVGKAIEIINVGEAVVVSGLHTMVCRPKQKYSPKYLGYYMNSPAFHDQLKPYMQGIKVTSIGRKNIKDVFVMYPSDLEEQRLIADFLSDFDEAIAAAKKELELWKELKRGLLQQMFV